MAFVDLPELREVEYGSAFYKAAIDLRTRVLRAPLGLTFSEEQLAAEQNDIHLTCVDDANVIACVVLTSIDGHTVKIRQMAVDPRHQKQGQGLRLLSYAEEVARAKGFAQAVLHARLSALGFYEKAGYRAVGETFIDVTIPHKKMVKTLIVANE